MADGETNATPEPETPAPDAGTAGTSGGAGTEEQPPAPVTGGGQGKGNPAGGGGAGAGGNDGGGDEPPTSIEDAGKALPPTVTATQAKPAERDPEAREVIRSDLARGLLWLLTITIGAVIFFVGLGQVPSDVLTQSIFPSLVTLTGTARLLLRRPDGQERLTSGRRHRGRWVCGS